MTSTTFNESEVLRTSEPTVATVGGTIRLFYNDEHALALGIRQVTGPAQYNPGTFPVTPFTPPSGVLAMSAGVDHNGSPVASANGELLPAYGSSADSRLTPRRRAA